MEELLSDRFRRAVNLASDLFRDIPRAVSGLPYDVHLFGVCHIVQQLTDDEDVHIAALLHDVLEDIPAEKYAAAQLEKDFGPRVLELVQTVSHNEPLHGKDQARTVYLQQLQAGPIEACLISGADMLHNIMDLVAEFRIDPEPTRRVFGGQERVDRRDRFYSGRYDIIQERLGDDHRLVKELGPALEQLHAVHQQIRG